MKDDIEVPSALLQKFDKHGYYYYKDAKIMIFNCL